MTMFVEQQSSPIPTNQSLEKKNEGRSPMSPLSEEIRQRAARWRKIRDTCPDLTISPDGQQQQDGDDSRNTQEGDQQQQQHKQQAKSRRISKRRAGRLRYSDMMNSKLGESWHPESGSSQLATEQLQNQLKPTATTTNTGSNNSKETTRVKNRLNLFQKTHSVPDFGNATSLEESLRKVPGASMKKPQGEDATLDESIESLRPFSEIRINPTTQQASNSNNSTVPSGSGGGGNTVTPKSSSGRGPNKSLDDFLDSLIFDARKSRIDAATMSVGSKPQRTLSSRDSRSSSKELFHQAKDGTGGKISSPQAVAVGTVSGDRVSLTFVSDDNQDLDRSALDPPQVIGRKKSSSSGALFSENSSSRGKDPPGKVKKRPGALGGFLDKGRKKRPGRPTAAATVAGDQVAGRLKSPRSRGNSKGRSSSKSVVNEGGPDNKNNAKKGKAGNSARSILDALLSPRKSTTNSIPENTRATSKAASAALETVSPVTLKRAYSMSVMDQDTILGSDTIRTGNTDILSDNYVDDSTAGPKKGKKKGGAQLGGFLDRRRQPHSRKSGANTVAGDRVAVRHSKSMGRSTKEVLKRLEADKKGELQRMASESTGTKAKKSSRNSNAWVPRRSISNAGVESSSVAARLRLQQIESAATSEESDVIEDSERMFERIADKSTDSNDSEFEEDGFDPHQSTSKLDLEGFWDRKNSRSLRGRKAEAYSSSGRRSSRGRSGKRPSRKSGNKKGNHNADIQSSVFGESWRRPRSQSKNSEDRTSEIDIIGSMLEPEGADNVPAEDSSGRRPRVDNNAVTSKQMSRRRLLKKVQSLSSLGIEKHTSGEADLVSPIKKKSKSGRKSPTAGLVGSEKQSDKGSRERSSALAEEIYIREDGKKVRRVHRKAIDGEILTRPDGKKVRIRRKNRVSKGNSVEIESKNDIPKEEPKKKSRSWLDQYLNGDDIPMASGHTRPSAGRSLSGTIDTAKLGTADAKPLSLRMLRDSETSSGPVSKPQSLRVMRDAGDTGSDSGGDAPATPLSAKDRRNMFRKINSVPALMAASPLVNLYEKKPNDVKERMRRALDGPDSPGKEKVAAESDVVAKRTRGSPTRKKKALSVQGGNISSSLLDLYDKHDSTDPVKPGSLRSVGSDAEQIAPTSNKSATPDASRKNAQKGETRRPKDKAERAEDKKRQLLQKSSKLRKVQSLSNLGHRQYDLADRHLLVERLKILNNDARLTPLRSRPKLDTSDKAESKNLKDNVRSQSRERTAADAKRGEVLTPNTLRRLRKVSSHSDISSITRQSSNSQAAEVSKALQFARWKSPIEKTTEIAVKSPKRRLSDNSSAGSLERNILAKSGIPSIDLDVDISPEADVSPARPSSARTMGSAVTAPPSSLRTLNSGSTPTPPTSSRTLNSDTGSKKEAPPDLPMRKQSLHPGDAERASAGVPDASDKGQPPLAPRKRANSQATATLPPRSTTPTPNQCSEKDLKDDKRPSLLNLGPQQSPFRRSLARWSSVPKDLGSTVNSSSLTKDEGKGATKTSEEREAPMHRKTFSKERTDESSSKSRASGGQFPAPGSQLLVYDDASTVCSDITDCWTNEVMSNWLAAESRRRAAGHNRRNTYDLGSIINEEAGAEGSSRFERSPLQMNRWESASKLIKDANESLPTPRRPTDDNASKEEEEAAKRFGWLKKLSFPRGKSDSRSDEGALLDDQSHT